jgi:haloalkane dehalogenase
MPGNILRTPEHRFQNLADYPFEPHYARLEGIRIHYVDENPASGNPVLLMHGEPSWSFLYRKMVRPLVEGGLRVVAPDLVGFGRSDKPAARGDYSYQSHVDWMTRWLETVDLRNATLVGQDWGALIGLRLAAEHPERFSRIVIANGALPTGDERLPVAFRVWRAFVRRSPRFPVGWVMRMGCKTPLPPEVIRGYEAPFPERIYLAGAIAFPELVPTRPDDPASAPNRAAWQVLERWDKPFMTAFSDGDPIMRGIDRVFQRRVPGAEGQPHTIIQGAGHFLQEDRGPELARAVLDFINANP